MIRRLGTALAGGLLLTIVGLTTLPTAASADTGTGDARPQTYLCNVGDSGSTATVQTTDINGAAAVMPAFFGMPLDNCRLLQ
ncbi:hypothetical protein DN069_35870 [Streptacidiphilus pinicola]|uniref:Uncharacterized protein n=1 Tax=Streptacidiphilus pinicola TaxID=2219663 RepID=A0A2X0JVF9_9ACTN|nr:hypothetical protein [Streptacidiphilus pinicola]RAG80885.1 hypothetical protein DN069_35870 [Streptacidiphilus pinicola]